MRRILFLSMILLSVPCLAEDKGAHSENNRLTGESQPLGDGTVHAFVELDKDGRPTAVGVSFTAGMLRERTANKEKKRERTSMTITIPTSRV